MQELQYSQTRLKCRHLAFLSQLENYYFRVYQLNGHPSLLDYQLSDRDVEQYFENHEKTGISRNGNVLLKDQSAEGELQIGFHVSRDIQKSINSYLESDHVNITHLNAICVCIEEMSHFHLIVSRALKNRSTSLLELEFQAEIDKVLISCLYFRNAWNIRANQIYKSITEPEPNCHLPEHYQKAYILAKRFFEDFRKHIPCFHQLLEYLPFRSLIKHNYYAPWFDKLTMAGTHAKGVQFQSLVIES